MFEIAIIAYIIQVIVLYFIGCKRREPLPIFNEIITKEIETRSRKLAENVMKNNVLLRSLKYRRKKPMQSPSNTQEFFRDWRKAESSFEEHHG